MLFRNVSPWSLSSAAAAAVVTVLLLHTRSQQFLGEGQEICHNFLLKCTLGASWEPTFCPPGYTYVLLYLLSEEMQHSCFHEPCAAHPGHLVLSVTWQPPHANCTSTGSLPAVTVTPALQVTANRCHYRLLALNRRFLMSYLRLIFDCPKRRVMMSCRPKASLISCTAHAVVVVTSTTL